MNKIQLFSEKATYASPSSKLIVLQSRQCIMQGSGDGIDDIGNKDVEDQTDDWDL